jgi:hypothetical protein
MDKIKGLTDFYMWMQENDYDHNIRIRVEKKAEIYLKTLNQGQTLPLDMVSGSVCKHEYSFLIPKKGGALHCGDCDMHLLQNNSEQLVCSICNYTEGNAPKGANFCNMCDKNF